MVPGSITTATSTITSTGCASPDSPETVETRPLELVGFDTISDDDVDSEYGDIPFEDAYGQMMGLQSLQPEMLYISEDSESVEIPLDELESQFFYQRLECVSKPKVNQFFVDLGVTFSSIHCGAYHSLCMYFVDLYILCTA